jgi:hypothetical protein
MIPPTSPPEVAAEDPGEEAGILGDAVNGAGRRSGRPAIAHATISVELAMRWSVGLGRPMANRVRTHASLSVVTKRTFLRLGMRHGIPAMRHDESVRIEME